MSVYDCFGKVLVVTSASDGIGLATVEHFYQCGASIASTYNNNLAITELTHTLDISAKRWLCKASGRS